MGPRGGQTDGKLQLHCILSQGAVHSVSAVHIGEASKGVESLLTILAAAARSSSPKAFTIFHRCAKRSTTDIKAIVEKEHAMAIILPASVDLGEV